MFQDVYETEPPSLTAQREEYERTVVSPAKTRG